jgi:putative ATP-dependent endonuclease of OLD family
MHLSHALIEHFRGIVRLSIDFDDTTVLIGENASGKTSVLDALSICLGHHNHGNELAFGPHDFHLRASDGKGPPPPIVVRMTFTERETGEWEPLDALTTAFIKASAGLRQIVLEVRADQGDDGIHASWRFLDHDGDELHPQPDPELLRAVRDLSPFLLVRADRYFPRREPTGEPARDTQARRREPELAIEREIGRVYNELIMSDGPAPADELRKGLAAVAQLIGDNADRVFQNPEAPDRALDELVERPVVLSLAAGPELEASLHGHGARSVALLLLVGAMLEARGPTTVSPDASMVLAIEEPEVHLHPLLLAAVWSVIESLRAQKIVTTNSGELLAAARLRMLRRLVRRTDRTDVYKLGEDTLSLDETRKVTYHLRLKRDDALFARAWLLVEGETEVWLLPELARLLGCDFASEGIRCVEFAQSGVEPLVKVANHLGIEWHLLSDGDIAGRTFAQAARPFLGRASLQDRLTAIHQRDIEHLLWDSGYAYVYHSVARGRSTVSPTAGKKSRKNPSRVIDQAIRNTSKPYLALTVVEQAGEEGSPGVPQVLRSAIETTLRLARSASPPTATRRVPAPAEG